jgi:hypothetical protein
VVFFGHGLQRGWTKKAIYQELQILLIGKTDNE